MFCEYSDIFGLPGTGVHSYRVFDIAVFDVILVILVAFVVSCFTKFNIYYIIIFLFILGVIAHRLFCVRTTIDRLIFG